jgi:hypothetical protein
MLIMYPHCSRRKHLLPGVDLAFRRVVAYMRGVRLRARSLTHAGRSGKRQSMLCPAETASAFKRETRCFDASRRRIKLSPVLLAGKPISLDSTNLRA